MQIYRELRCKFCGKLLAKGSGFVQIKCTHHPLDGRETTIGKTPVAHVS